MFTCDICDADANNACTRCVGRIYCSETCQRADWIEHRDVCVQVEDVEGAFDRLRRRTQFASILPKYFVALYRYAVVAPTKQRPQMRRHRKAFQKEQNRLKASRFVVKGIVRQEIYGRAYDDLVAFSDYVIWFHTQDPAPEIFYEYLGSLKTVGLAEMITPEIFKEFIFNVVVGAAVGEKKIETVAKTWGTKLDTHFDKIK